MSGFGLGPLILLALVALATSLFADDFDGSTPLMGVTEKVIEINPFKVKAAVDPDTVGLPKKFVIDFESKRLRPSKDSLVRKTIAFNRLVQIENKLVMQGVDAGVEGVDDGLAWSLTISKTDGRAVLFASGGGVAYVVFGTCMPIEDGP